MILGLQQELKAEGVAISLVKLCQWFEIPRRTVYYHPTKGKPKLQEKSRSRTLRPTKINCLFCEYAAPTRYKLTQFRKIFGFEQAPLCLKWHPPNSHQTSIGSEGSLTTLKYVR